MRALLGPCAAPFLRAVTYTRWLHLLVPAFLAFACGAVYPGYVGLSTAGCLLVPVVPVPLLLLAAAFPSTRLAEGIQARVMLFPGAHASAGRGAPPDRGIAAAPSASLGDRVRTALWLVLRLEVGCLTALLTGQCCALSLALVAAGTGSAEEADPFLAVRGDHWAYAVLSPLPLVVLVALVAPTGAGMARAARGLLGPSPRERLAALEEETELLLERHRIARELHDSLGHALTVAVVQAGAARAVSDPAFTERALTAIEETGRTALDDLDRVLRSLRTHERGQSARPDLSAAARLMDSARAAGAEVEAQLPGTLDHVPGPVSREAYRMLQESLTNVLRHAGPVPVRVRVHAGGRQLELEVRNRLADSRQGAGREDGGREGSGLRGLRERAGLLGGRAEWGPEAGEWRVRVRLPLA
ncbi:sensor histidine kinase [Streptomyces sp. SCSIO ZS0520]|uniref:sensor histidine kinase n=1 Tax=Streptomyces sp. SCSIO ZS0520 TaxID=2892996 RepID=UPI0021DA6DAF|nr:histidine kinase [Streptomyces sp. SCSIO ZS0520]